MRREVCMGVGQNPHWVGHPPHVVCFACCRGAELTPFTFSAPVARAQMSQREEPSLRYGEGTERLSQLSDIVSLSQELDPPHKLHQRTQSVNCAQDSLLDLVEDLPSQAVLPTPELPFASQRNDTSGACEAQLLEPDIPSETANMPFEEDEQAYVPERTKSSRRTTRRG